MQKALKNIDKYGYYVQESCFSESYCEKLKKILIEAPLDSVVQNKDKDFHGSNTTIIPNILPLNEAFINLAMNEKFINLASEYFKPGQFPSEKDPFQLSLMHARKVSKGAPAQELHIDSRLCGAKPPLLLHIFIYLDDCLCEGSGATQIVPGSHEYNRYSNQGDYLNTRELRVPKGSVVYLNSNLYHGSSAKKTDDDRWIITLAYSRWWIRQPAAIPYFTGWPRELSIEEKRLFGFFNYAEGNNNLRPGKSRGPLPKLVPENIDY